MKELVTNIVFVVIIVLATWHVQATWFPTVETQVRTDTTFVDRPFEVEVIKEVEREVPVEVVRYETKYDTIESVKVERDTVFIKTPTNLYTYDSSFLTQYPQAHKFLGLVRSQGQTSLTTLSPNGITETKTWQVSDNYRIDSQLNLSSQGTNRFGYDYRFGAGYIRYWESGGAYLQFSQNFRIFNVNIENTININENPFVTVGVTW